MTYKLLYIMAIIPVFYGKFQVITEKITMLSFSSFFMQQNGYVLDWIIIFGENLERRHLNLRILD